jgi:hypothetical protein
MPCLHRKGGDFGVCFGLYKRKTRLQEREREREREREGESGTFECNTVGQRWGETRYLPLLHVVFLDQRQE